MIRLFLAVLLCVGAPGYSQAADSSEAKDGPFGGKLMIVDDIAAFWRAWEGPTPPHIETVSTMTRAAPVFAVLVFHGCAAGPDGNCDVAVTFSVTAPDGSASDEPVNGIALKGPPAPGMNLLASEGSFGFALEPEDKYGRYTLRATLTDRVTGKSVTLQDVVDAVSSTEPVPPVV